MTFAHLIPNPILIGHLHEADPALESQPEVYTTALLAMLRRSANEVVRACQRGPAQLPRVVANEYVRLTVCPSAAAAFLAFAENVESELYSDA